MASNCASALALAGWKGRCPESLHERGVTKNERAATVRSGDGDKWDLQTIGDYTNAPNVTQRCISTQVHKNFGRNIAGRPADHDWLPVTTFDST